MQQEKNDSADVQRGRVNETRSGRTGTTTGRPERLFTKLEHFHQIRARFLKKHLTMRCRWCLLRQHFELCVIYMFENKRTPALHLSSTSTDEKAQFTVCNTRGAVCDLTKRSRRSSRRACAPTLSTEASRKREASRAERSKKTLHYTARRGAAAGFFTQTLSQEEGATTVEPLHAGERQDPVD